MGYSGRLFVDTHLYHTYSTVLYNVHCTYPDQQTICYCRVHNKINYKSGVFSREISFKKQRSDVILWNIFCSVRKFLLQPRVRWQFFLLAKIIVFLCVNLFKSGTWIRIYPYEKLDPDSNKMVLIMLYLRIFLSIL